MPECGRGGGRRSAGGSKSVPDMADDRSTVLLEFHRQNIEAAGQPGRFRVLVEIASGDFPDLAPLGRGHGLFGIAEMGIGPGLDFDENEDRAVAGDDVDFSPAVAVSALDDPKAPGGQIEDGRFLAAAS
jgi:hypothetical protein